MSTLVGAVISQRLKASDWAGARALLGHPPAHRVPVEVKGLRRSEARVDPPWHDVMRAAVDQQLDQGGLEKPLLEVAHLIDPINWASAFAARCWFAVQVADRASPALVEALRARLDILGPAPARWGEVRVAEEQWRDGYRYFQACRHAGSCSPRLTQWGLDLAEVFDERPLKRWRVLRLDQVRHETLRTSWDGSQVLQPRPGLREALVQSCRLLGELSQANRLEALRKGGYAVHNLPAMLRPDWKSWSGAPEPGETLQRLRRIAEV